MEIMWLGTAGFQISTGKTVFLIDPYLSRNSKSIPKQNLAPADIKTASSIFVSHGHFDHILDIPQIAFQTGADIYGSDTVADYMVRSGTDKQKIKTVLLDGMGFKFPEFTAQAIFSRHVRFDLSLVLSTLMKINLRFFRYLPLIRNFPCGQVLSWLFYIEDRVIRFFGSVGSSPEELERMGDIPVDILMLPLQGHSDICKIGLSYVKHLKPAIVIPHHYDSFFPPISKTVDINAFVDGVKKHHPKTRVVIPQLNTTLTL